MQRKMLAASLWCTRTGSQSAAKKPLRHRCICSCRCCSAATPSLIHPPATFSCQETDSTPRDAVISRVIKLGLRLPQTTGWAHTPLLIHIHHHTGWCNHQTDGADKTRTSVAAGHADIGLGSIYATGVGSAIETTWWGCPLGHSGD